MERIILSLPREMLDELDTRAQQLERKRSKLIREALGEWLELQHKREFEELLAEGYRERAAELEQTAEEWLPLTLQAVDSTWRWDE
jgi:metal-responsive CopG/Arc/MetJ family transcriptional regulator